MHTSLITICGTSYLLPNSNAWDIIKKNNDVKFTNYNNFDEILIDNNTDYFVCVINFKDLIDFPLNDISEKNLKKIIIKINKLFRVFRNKLKENRQKLLLIYDLFYTSQILKLANNDTTEEKIINYLQKKIISISKFKNFFSYNLANDKVYEHLFDEKFYYLARCRYSLDGLISISNNINKILFRIEKPAKKVLVLDFDNTLWGGVIGEDGIHKVSLGGDGEGNIYLNFQKSIKRLKNEGVILVGVTKNDLSIVNQIFKQNKNMFLKKNDFSLIYANWDRKSKNIKRISENLDLGLSSFVFFDDNPMEREEVKKILPQVEVIEPHDEISSWPQQIFDQFSLNKLVVTKDDIKKSHQYTLNLKFKSDKKINHNQEQFLGGLKLKANKIKISKSNISRAIQIAQKTNQFNLRTIRYKENELFGNFDQKKKQVFLINLSDKYGDHGLIGLVVLRLTKDYLFIENIAVSCRVLGRYIEHWIMKEIKKIAKKFKIKTIVGEFIKTERNEIVLDFFEKLNFKNFNLNDNKNYDYKKLFVKKSKKYISKVNDINCKYSKFYKL